jgi:hypothetical protein
MVTPAGRPTTRLLGALMPFWYIGTLVVLIAGAGLSRNVLTIAAVALMAAALVLTVTVLVPINNRIGAWRSDAMFVALAVGIV